jgi:hypothetical protein
LSLRIAYFVLEAWSDIVQIGFVAHRIAHHYAACILIPLFTGGQLTGIFNIEGAEVSKFKRILLIISGYFCIAVDGTLDIERLAAG